MATRVLTNYLAGQAANLEADLTEDAAVTLPTVTLQVTGIDEVSWAGPNPDSTAVLATVTATDPSGGAYRLAYELGIARPDSDDRPYVDFIHVIPTAG